MTVTVAWLLLTVLMKAGDLEAIDGQLCVDNGRRREGQYEMHILLL